MTNALQSADERQLVKGARQQGKRRIWNPARAASTLWRLLKRNLTLLGLLVVWHIAAEFVLPSVLATSSLVLPSPVTVLSTGWDQLIAGDLIVHAWVSLGRILSGFAVAALIAVPMGIAMGWWRGVENQLGSIIAFLRPIPPLAWIPLTILWLGITNAQNVSVIFIAVFFPVLLNTWDGVRGVDSIYIRAAQSLGASSFTLLRRVILPSALPSILTGLRVGLGIGWMALVAAELVAATSGLGFLINDSRSILRTDLVMVGMLAIGILGIILDSIFRVVIRRSIPWHPSQRREGSR